LKRAPVAEKFPTASSTWNLRRNLRYCHVMPAMAYFLPRNQTRLSG
jgi:hypothetical protein